MALSRVRRRRPWACGTTVGALAGEAPRATITHVCPACSPLEAPSSSTSRRNPRSPNVAPFSLTHAQRLKPSPPLESCASVTHLVLLCLNNLGRTCLNLPWGLASFLKLHFLKSAGSSSCGPLVTDTSSPGNLLARRVAGQHAGGGERGECWRHSRRSALPTQAPSDPPSRKAECPTDPHHRPPLPPNFLP